MTTLMVQMISLAFLIVFGAMAFYPLLLNGTDVDAPAEPVAEDRVVSVAFGRTYEAPAAPALDRFPTCPLADAPDHSDERPAA